MSKGLTSVPKAPEHKAKIAASQRRRHAAVRVLTAVEAFHRGNQQGLASKPGVGPSPCRVSVTNPYNLCVIEWLQMCWLSVCVCTRSIIS